MRWYHWVAIGALSPVVAQWWYQRRAQPEPSLVDLLGFEFDPELQAKNVARTLERGMEAELQEMRRSIEELTGRDGSEGE